MCLQPRPYDRPHPLEEAHTMSTLAAFLLLWGLSLSPAAEAATFFETQPDLWAEAGSLQEPWANLTLVCRAPLVTTDFQLFKDGALQEQVHLDEGATEQRFPLGAVTGGTRGLYRCRYAMDSSDGWTSLSNLLEVTGPGTLPAPVLSSKPVSWVTQGLRTTLLCRAGLRGVTFLLRREGDAQFLELAEAPQAVEAAFPVHRAGNYSCSYRTHEAGPPSEPSATVTIEEMARPPPPRLSVEGESGEPAALLSVGAQVSLGCVAPVEGVEFQLRRGDQELRVNSWSTTPGRVFFELKSLKPADSGLYTCRYQLSGEGTAWSSDSAPVELLLSDGTLPAPELSAESATPNPGPGALVTLRCRAPLAGQRFALLREDARGRRPVRGLQSPAGPEARFELRDVSPMDSSNYSCVYVGPAPPAGSAPSARLELRLDGPLPKPRLRPLWSGKVSPGRDAALRCETPVAHESLELLGAGEVVASTYGPSEDLVLTYVGPQHAGKYSCRYRSRWPLVSELSDPVELQVAER
ncbi:alpha-1B-glycoprotein isoform X2 [Eptesicus fuscus]|uniref:alpha-1B-glycoprotein isoform X2 n=1 Tax=Eptesicus fuscus TaxID=29078 RepID=UPI002403EC0E|nr:alpha-1B-glycoprotein isoform X2 [Eptesicus fuscus]